jgi:tetratricopeptide (TPR) repeat protein
MKKFLLIALVVVMALCLMACDSSDYKKAEELYQNGSYEEALVIYETLGDYEDSAKKAKDCKYEIAVDLFETKDYDSAVAMFEELGDYKNSIIFLNNVGWCKFTDFLTEQGRVVIKGTDADYTVTVRMKDEAVWAEYLFEGGAAIGGMDITLTATIEKDSSIALLEGEGMFQVLNSYMKDTGTLDWDITTYKKGGSIKWDKYSCTGIKNNGAPLDYGTVGMLSGGSLDTGLERLVAGIEAAANKSNSGITMADLGFEKW